MITKDQIEFLDPWDEVSERGRESFYNELKRELHTEHSLYGKEFEVIGRRYDQDDILISLKDEELLAVVHLTWSRKPETKGFPSCAYYTLQEFLDEMRAENADS